MITLHFQNAVATQLPVAQTQIEAWARAALTHETEVAEVTIRCVSLEESQQLNTSFRGKIGPTNVLSFPDTDEDTVCVSGAVVICPATAKQESQDQHLELSDHWCHLIVHGCLHLCGYDHIDKADAAEMEALEIQILASLGLENPYA